MKHHSPRPHHCLLTFAHAQTLIVLCTIIQKACPLTALNGACASLHVLAVRESPLFLPSCGRNSTKNVRQEMPGISIDSPSFPKPQDWFSCSNYVAWTLWIFKVAAAQITSWLTSWITSWITSWLHRIYRLRIRTQGVIIPILFTLT